VTKAASTAWSSAPPSGEASARRRAMRPSATSVATASAKIAAPSSGASARIAATSPGASASRRPVSAFASVDQLDRPALGSASLRGRSAPLLAGARTSLGSASLRGRSAPLPPVATIPRDSNGGRATLPLPLIPESRQMWIMRAATLCCLGYAALACGSGEQAQGADAAAARGKLVYENVCTACHNRDPRQAGALGPELAGASLELIEAKVMRNEYPPGYAPKRPGATMPKYEYLAPNLSDIAAYLASVQAG